MRIVSWISVNPFRSHAGGRTTRLRPWLGMSWLGLAAATLLAPAGCRGPIAPVGEATMRQAVITEHQQRLAAIRESEPRQVEREPSDVEQQLSSQRKEQLDQMSGPSAYGDKPLDLGPDLLGDPRTETVALSLQRSVELAVEHNLELQQARMTPAIARAQVTRARAQFDAMLFAEAAYEKRDTPRPGGGAGPVATLSNDQQTETIELRTGIRKPLTTGGTAAVETRFNRQFEEPTFFSNARGQINTFYNSDLLLRLEQPLLRGFGTDVNTAQIRLARNAERSQVQQLKSTLLQRVLETEQAYWDLMLAKRQLQIQRQLLQRTIADRDRLKARMGFDVSPVRLTEADSFVELRRGEVIRARQALRRASDQLKRLMNAPSLPVAGETLVVPVDAPVDAPIAYSLLDSVTTALRRRPVLQRSLLNIKDASIRQRVADNGRLPQLDLNASVGVNGLDIDGPGEALENSADLNFIDYVLGATFEYPIGNRGPNAQFTRRRLQRRQAVLDYRDQAQQVVLDVKNALRRVAEAYKLIGSARAARRAAANSLRAINEQEAAGAALTPEFLLDLKLETQQRLADAQVQEARALSDYNTAISRFYRAMGTLLDRNGIAFEPTEP